VRLETMNKKITTLVTRNGVQASATASYANRYAQGKKSPEPK